MTARMRLDVLLVERGLAPSRERAQALIMEGSVLVDGQPRAKAGQAVAADAQLALTSAGMPFVSRGGLKLRRALDVFGLDPTGQVCLDVGASTGGFTDCLLQAGAARVYALDVGYGQLHWHLRTDPRVVVLEKMNARHLEAGSLPEQPAFAVIDVSFISLTKVLEPVGLAMGFGAPDDRPPLSIVALVKPQFEVGPKRAPRGVVRDPAAHRAALHTAIDSGRALGWRVAGLTESPLLGPAGNREFLLWLATGAQASAFGDIEDEDVERCVGR
ncbi:MAG TPA: TlyA family RNA methyltransferase [Chloroflexota bacterium]|nr:TlyA family RNA methyltransferase [Chloroflexota bacterium]